MKKKFLLALAAVVMLASCAKEDRNPPDLDNGETAYISFKLSAPPTTRANTEVVGSTNESTMNSATVLLFDNNDKCLGSVDFTDLIGNPSTSSKEVPAKTKKVFVVVNKINNWDLTSDVVKDKTFDDINTYVDVTAPSISADGAFLMTNTGTLAGGALNDVIVHKTSEEAKNAPAEIWVDRVTSKVILKKNANITITPAGSTFEFGAWEINTTNKKTSLYSARVAFTGATSAVTSIYRRDNNYYKIDFDNGPVAYIKENYNWLTNGTDGATMSPIARPAYVDDATTPTGKAYITENTMDANAQLWGHTTKAVIKGTYTPTGIADKTSYFAYKSKYYSVGNLKTEYIKGERTDLKADLIIFLTAAYPAGTTYGELDAQQKADPININTAIDGLDQYSGILAKYKAVTFYYNSICYYDALIHHDQTNVDALALGRYGVVRNNAYELTINSVRGPGTPWIPDPTNPEDPTDPNDPDDEVEANLSIDVKLNKWTYWTQSGDLGK